MVPDTVTGRITAVRAFNRFYTNMIGVLRDGLLDTPYSLTEARVLFELAQQESTEVVHLRQALDIDAGYLSRILGRFQADGLVTKHRSSSDGRRHVIGLTGQGRRVFRTLDSRSAQQIRQLLSPLSDDGQGRLVAAMGTIRELLEHAPRPTAALRSVRAGDLGWVVHRHGVLYAQEYGWDQTFEGLVARIVADYVQNHRPGRENAWIADAGGRPVGCVFCVEKDQDTAQLRLLLVEPGARGAGVGTRLVHECIDFARRARYRQLMLWTNDVLHDARRIYERAGFTLADQQPHHSFGHDLVGQTWSLRL